MSDHIAASKVVDYPGIFLFSLPFSNLFKEFVYPPLLSVKISFVFIQSRFDRILSLLVFLKAFLLRKV